MDMGCICYLANLCVGAAMNLIPLFVEDVILDIYCHFNQRSKREEEYKAFLEFQDIDPLKIIKHFQDDASRNGLLHDQVKRLLRIFMKRFAKTSVIVAHTDVTLVPYNVGANFLPDNKLVVGLPCRGFPADHQDEVGVETEKKLYRTALFLRWLTSFNSQTPPYRTVPLSTLR
ncbi:Hypothetical predicted protein [Mytilus galloprovincialis]|uniref:Uncharacterized protein n=1 Tax=Mytilus galloprovincialis TaxID=29158 RepID=A0A8B6HRI7_MYTGA|nr:Hypothetical predicted protein [Mytilus galloprovincialis]